MQNFCKFWMLLVQAKCPSLWWFFSGVHRFWAIKLQRPKMIFLWFFSLRSLIAQNLCTLEQNHHKLGRLACIKSIQNFQKFCIYLNLDRSYAGSSEFLTGCRISATVQNRIENLNFLLYEHFLWTKPDLLVPQTWLSVNQVDLQMKNKSVPLHVQFRFHCTWQ